MQHIDIMKAIGIVLVVVGHAPGLNDYVMSTIYSFHMPLFFFISGLLLSEEKLLLNKKDYLILQIRALGIPYLFFWLISYLYWLPTHHLSGRAHRYIGISWWEPIAGVFIGNGAALFVNDVLWFFTCLFTTALIFFAARKYFSSGTLFMAFNFLAVIFTLVYDPSWPRLPWGLDNAIVALSFFSAGHFFRRYQHAILQKTSKNRAGVFALFLFAGVLYFAAINGKVDLSSLFFGSYKPLYFISAYAGIFSLFYFSLTLSSNAIFHWLSRNTLIIFPIHLLMFGVFTGIAVVVFGMPPSFKEGSLVWTALFAVLALLLSYPASLFLYRFFPQILGKRKPLVPLPAS